MPELNIPPEELLIVDKLDIFNTDNAKVYLQNIEIYGICDFIINFVHEDLNNFHFNFNMTYNHIRINTTYDFNIHILTQIAHKGIMHITLGK